MVDFPYMEDLAALRCSQRLQVAVKAIPSRNGYFYGLIHSINWVITDL